MQNEDTGVVATVANSGQQVISHTVDSLTAVASHTGGAITDTNQHLVTIESTLVQKAMETGQLTIKELGDLIKDLTGHLTGAIKDAF